MMLERAKAHAEFLEVNVAKVITRAWGLRHATGGQEACVKDKGIDGVVTLGCVIEGETEHDEIVITNAARKITDLSVEYGKPVSLGITGPGMTRLQAEDRIEKGRDAVESVVKMLKRLEDDLNLFPSPP